MEDLTKKWYKKGFKSLKVIAPYKVWQEVENALKKWPSHWYVSNSEELIFADKDKVWASLAQNLKTEKALRRNTMLRPYKLAASILVFISMPYLLQDQRIQNSYFKNELAKNELINESSVNTNRPSSNPKMQGNDVNVQKKEDMIFEDQRGSETTQIDQNAKPNKELFNEEKTAVNSDNFNIVSDDYSQFKRNEFESLRLIKMDYYHLLSKDFQLEFISKSMLKRNLKWSIGLQAKLQQGDLLTPISQNRNEDFESKFNPISLSLGIRAARAISLKNSIQLELNINERRSYNYDKLSSFGNTNNRLEMNYTTFSTSLVTQLSINKRSTKNQSIDFITGAFVSYRNSIDEYRNNTSISYLKNGFSRMNTGLNLGLEYSIDVLPRLKLSTGFNYRLGCINIFKGIDKVPSGYFKTHTSAAGLAFTASYKF